MFYMNDFKWKPLVMEQLGFLHTYKGIIIILQFIFKLRDK